MTASYDPTLPTDRDKVRLLIGDTDTASPKFQDSEIDAILVAQPNTYYASAQLLDSLAAKYATTVSINVDGFSTSGSDIAKAYRDMAARYRAQAPLAGAGGLAVPFVGGISVSEIESIASDEDRTPNEFTHDMLSNNPDIPTR